jgi:hypothetical protein
MIDDGQGNIPSAGRTPPAALVGEPMMDKVRMNLDGLNGNAFNLLGAFSAAATRQGWSKQQISVVVNEAMGGDYQHLLRTLDRYTEPVER